jgi:hypothetical protein
MVHRMKSKVFGIRILDERGRVVGEKIAEAPSAEYIFKHKSKFLGRGRYVGGVRKTRIKDYAKWHAQPRSRRFPHG